MNAWLWWWQQQSTPTRRGLGAGSGRRCWLRVWGGCGCGGRVLVAGIEPAPTVLCHGRPRPRLYQLSYTNIEAGRVAFRFFRNARSYGFFSLVLGFTAPHSRHIQPCGPLRCWPSVCRPGTPNP